MAEFEKVATLADLPPGGRLPLVFDERAVLLVRVGEELFAVEDVCSHDGQPLTDGRIEGKSIECPRHGARFDLCSGRPLCMPAVEPIATYEVERRGDDIYLRTRL